MSHILNIIHLFKNFVILDNHVGNTKTIYVGDNSSVLLEHSGHFYHDNEWYGPYDGGTMYSLDRTINQQLPVELRNRLELVPTSWPDVYHLRINAFSTSDEGTYVCLPFFRTYNVYITGK